MISSKVTIDDIAAYRAATGCPIAQCESTLLAMSSELRKRVLIAARTQKAGHTGLRDPIEDDPKYSAIIRSASLEAQSEVAAKGISGRGSGGAVNIEQARILKVRYGLDWYSPREMNPHIVYD